MASSRLVTTIRKTPLVVSGILVQLLRHYLNENSVDFKPPVDFQSEDYTRLDSLLITTHDSFDLETTQVRPAVVIRRGELQYERIAMNDMRKRSIDGSAIGHVMWVTGSYVLLCIAKNAGVVERLAEEVSEVLIGFKQAIRQDFAFHRFDYRATGEVGLLEESQEFKVIPCTVAIAFSESWDVERTDLPKIGKVSFAFSAVNDAFGTELWPSDPVARGEALAQEIFLKKTEGVNPCSAHEPERQSTAEKPGVLYTSSGAPPQGHSTARLAAKLPQPDPHEEGRVDDVDGFGDGLFGDGNFGQ